MKKWYPLLGGVTGFLLVCVGIFAVPSSYTAAELFANDPLHFWIMTRPSKPYDHPDR